MVRVNVKVDIKHLPNFEHKTTEIQERSLNLISQTLLRNLVKNSPVVHGVLNKWAFINEGSNPITIRSPAEYTRYVNDGTGMIYPKNRKALRFKPTKKWNGKIGKDGYVYLRYSRGQKGQKFVEKSIQQTRAKVEGLVIKATREAFK